MERQTVENQEKEIQTEENQTGEKKKKLQMTKLTLILMREYNTVSLKSALFLLTVCVFGS